MHVPEVARAIGVKNTAFYDLEKGENFFSPEMLLKLSNHYSVSPAAFFTDDVVKVIPTPAQAWEIVGKALQAFERDSMDLKVSPLHVGG